ncbi:MAG: ABC transporter [Microbacterium sp.]
MSDPQYAEPVEQDAAQATSAADVVASANAGLADAEAVSREVVADETAVADAVAEEPAAATVAYGEGYGKHWDDEPVDESYTPGAYSTTPADAAPTEVVAPAAASVADVAPTVAVAPAAPAAPSPQPIFVQAPEAPQPRGNRGAAGAIGLLAAVSFGILYLGAALGLRLLSGEIVVTGLGTEALVAVTSWWLWVPVVVFFLAFWLLGAIINRARWGYWVIFGLLVGGASYGGHLLGQLFQAPFWTLTARQGQELVAGQLLAPLAIVALVIGRELTIWFGAWAAARGKRISELNREAQREYERTLEAGPRIQQG